MTGTVVAVIGFGGFAAGALLILAAAHDLAARTVPNPVPILLALLGAVLQLAAGHLPASLGAALAVFIAAAFCWRRGWLGGADAKLLGAVSLLVAPRLVPSLLLAIALAGGALALLYLALRRLVRKPRARRPASLAGRILRAEAWRIARRGSLPYAAAIAAGTLFSMSRS